MIQNYKSSTPKVLSLFAGAGGCSLGFKQAGCSIVYASDIDKAALSTYRSNFPDAKCEQHDIKQITIETLLSASNLKVGELDVLIGGPPCQGFSTAGPRFWDDPRNALLKQYVRILDGLRPKWFLMENVEGLLTTKKGEYIYEAIKAFMSIGYIVRLEKIYAQEYGVPQRRKRVIIVGNRLGCDFDFPQPTEEARGSIFRYTKHTLRSAIGDLPEPAKDNQGRLSYSQLQYNEFQKYLRNKTTDISDHYSSEINGIVLKRIKALKIGQSMKDLPVALQHESFKYRSKRRVMDGTPSEKRGGAPSGIKRLFPDEPSLTITGAAIREFVHPEQDRFLTIRECARLQTFPDWFNFNGTESQKIQQIGNAIPPLLARRFAEHIIANNLFDKTNKNSGEGKLLGYKLTKASAMSPALMRTNNLLIHLQGTKEIQLSLFQE